MNIVLAWAAVTNIPQAGWLKQQTFVKVPTDVSGEGPLPGLQMTFFSLYPHMAEGRERGHKLSYVFSGKCTNLIHKDSTPS